MYVQALVQEKLNEWQEKFGSNLGLSCRELTGKEYRDDDSDVRHSRQSILATKLRCLDTSSYESSEAFA